ncbi:MAG: hypothetical protein WCJ30_13420 [Deltaproteobacteria bacterium]
MPSPPTATEPATNDPPPGGPVAPTRRRLYASLVTFAALLALLELGFRASTLGRRCPTDSYYTLEAGRYSASAGFDIAIVGDSRVLHGVDPRVVERVLREQTGRSLSVWNAGLPGAPPMAHLAWIERFLSHPHRPRLVMLSISPNAFGSLLPDPPSRESLTAIYRLRDLTAARRAGASVEDLATITTANLFHLFNYRARLLRIVLNGEGVAAPTVPGIQGYGPIASVTPDVQDSRARHRLLGYANEMHRMSAHFGNEQIGYFRECLRRLREAGIRTVLMNSPSSTQLDAAYGPESMYAQHMAFVRAEARAYGLPFIDVEHSPAITDADFTDGDHLSVQGAARFSEWLARVHIAPVVR